MEGEDPQTWFCSVCDIPAPDALGTPKPERIPCPTCGSTTRNVRKTLSAEMGLHPRLELKGRRPGLKKPFVEQLIGADWSHRFSRFMHRDRRIDRAEDWYDETVTDPETGAVLHECHEPLTRHQRGSAKRS